MSTDGGHHFELQELVAPPPMRWDPAAPRGVPPPHGYFGPSNVVRAPDGWFYTLVFAITSRTDASRRGTCLLRTDDPSLPGRWRFWDGQGFDLEPVNPYDLREGTDATPCAFVSPGAIGGLSGSLTWNTYLQGWLLVGADVFPKDGQDTCGIWFSTSPDLVTWSAPALIQEGPLPYPPCNPRGADRLGDIYPSIIDPDDMTPSFERSGQTPWLYFTRWMRDLDRPLMRARLTFAR